MRTLKEHQFNNVLYDCIKNVLVSFRLLGFLPLEGLCRSNCKKTRFVPKSLYTIVFGIIILSQSLCFVLIYYCLFHTHTRKKVVRDCSQLIEVTTCIMVCLSICHFCKYWTPTLRKVECIEMLLPPLRNGNLLICRIKWFVFIMSLLSLAEYIACNIYTVVIVKDCFLLEEDSGWYLKSYFLASNSWFYHHVPFGYTSGVIMQIIKLQSMIICRFPDILVVIVTAYLSARFKNLYGNLVHRSKQREKKPVPWTEFQTQFTSLTKLVSLIDDLISPFVFTTFLSHLLFICKQLYDILQKKRTANMFQQTDCVFNHSNDSVTIVSFTISLVALLFRMSMVSLMAARLHTLSRESLKALHILPASMYNHEMQRFMDQVYYSKIGLTGLRFFYVTRGTILSMISTLLTFELVLLQIND